MVRLQKTLCGRIEIVVPEIMGQLLLVVLHHHCKVTLHQIKAFYNTVSLVQAGFGENKHQECIQELFVLHEFNVALGLLWSQLMDCALVHLSEKN